MTNRLKYLFLLLFVSFAVFYIKNSNSFNKQLFADQKYNQMYSEVHSKIFTNDSPFSREEQFNLKNYSKLFLVITKIMPAYHINKEKNIDFLDKHYIRSVIDELDKDNSFFSKEDIIKLQKFHSWNLINQTDGLILFLNLYKIYNDRISEYKVLLQNFQYKDDKILLTYNKRLNNYNLKKHWNSKLIKRINYQLIKRKKDDITDQTVIKNVLKEINDALDDRLVDLQKKIYGSMISGYIRLHDPHSNYYLDNNAYDSFASSEHEGFGFSYIINNNQQVEITEVTKNSPAKKANLAENDLITAISDSDYTNVTHLTNLSQFKIEKAFDSIKTKYVAFIIKKAKSNKIMHIKMKKDIITEENKKISLKILNSIKNEKIAYIDIPLFYTAFKDNGVDVEYDFSKKISQINNLKINNLIIDLRNNGGGSFDASLSMLSHFIKKGPLIQIVDNNNKLNIFNAKKNKEIFKGNVVILINEYSASASEIFASTMQDYNRAIILGSNNSYGKGSVQTLVNFNQINLQLFRFGKMPVDSDILGFLQLTTQQIFRVTGDSTQIKGVKPDILIYMPYPNDNFKFEKDQDFPLPYREISPLKFNKFVIPNKEKLVNDVNIRYNNQSITKNHNLIYNNYIKISNQPNYSNKDYITKLESDMQAIQEKLDNIQYQSKNLIINKESEDFKSSILIDSAIDLLIQMEHMPHD